MIFWYRNSVLASIVSIFGSAMAIIAIRGMVSGELQIPAGILVALFGVGGVFLGKRISNRKAEKQARKAAEKAAASASSYAGDAAKNASAQSVKTGAASSTTSASAGGTAGTGAATASTGGNTGTGATAACFCRKCGAKLAPDDVFCAKCGVRVNETAAPSGGAPSTKEVLTRAWEWESKGDYATSLKILNEALKAAPDDAQLLIHAGRAQRNLGNLNEALALYEKAAAISPNDPTIYGNMGAVYINAKLYDKARPLYEKALSMVEGDPDLASPNDRASIMANYAYCVGLQGDLSTARFYLDRALSKGYSQEIAANIRKQLGL